MKKDVTKKRCLSDNERYADLINGVVFKGKQKIHAEDLLEMDTQTGLWSDLRIHGKRQHKQKYRDLIRKVAMGINFAVIGIENQEEVHYLMPLRSVAYDVAEYERQANIIKKKVRKEKGIKKAEFLSGFKRESRLYPCITLVLFFGETWDGSKDLHGILDFTDIPEEMKEYVNNYQMHLLEIRKLENTEVFQTDLKQIFDFIRYAKDKEKLKELVENDPVYKEMDEDAYDMAVEYTNAKELIAVKGYYGKDGKVDMCEALTALIKDGWKEGKEEGIKEGKKEGKKEGIKEGIKEGLDEKTRQIVRNMLERGMADEDIIALAECRQELIEEVRKGL